MSTATEHKELMVVKSTPVILEINFEELETALAKDLEKYRLVVTFDTIKGAKELAKELNKRANQIDTRRKEEVKKVSGPIKNFEEQMKKLVSMNKDGRQHLLDQIAKFEDETKLAVRKLLKTERDRLFNSLEIKPEFQSAELDNLIKVSNITGGGKLTATTKNHLEMRVREAKAMQDKVELRLVKLENESLKAGLSAPLTKAHIGHFIMDNDVAYETNLQRIITAEVLREEQAREKIRNDILRDQALETARQQAKRNMEVAEKERLDREQEREKEKFEQERLKKEQEKEGCEIIRSPYSATCGIEPPQQERDKREREKEKQNGKQDSAPQQVEVVRNPVTPPTTMATEYTSEPKRQAPQEPVTIPTGKILFSVTARFDITAPSTVDDERIEQKLRAKLAAAGITTLSSIEIKREQL